MRGTEHLQRQQDRREDRREAAQARGAARVLYAELFHASTQMAILASDRIYRRFDPSYAVEIPPEDRRLVAAKLSGDQWAT